MQNIPLRLITIIIGLTVIPSTVIDLTDVITEKGGEFDFRANTNGVHLKIKGKSSPSE